MTGALGFVALSLSFDAAGCMQVKCFCHAGTDGLLVELEDPGRDDGSGRSSSSSETADREEVGRLLLSLSESIRRAAVPFASAIALSRASRFESSGSRHVSPVDTSCVVAGSLRKALEWDRRSSLASSFRDNVASWISSLPIMPLLLAGFTEREVSRS